MNRNRAYDLIYAFAAQNGRETALFGSCATAAREAFSRSLAGDKFPIVWFEVPLSGDPWLDLHALVAYEDIAGTRATFAGQDGAYADALAWFTAQPPKTVRQLALSYDTHTGNADHPAVQLLMDGGDEPVALGFLEAIGLAGAQPAYRTFVSNMPNGWRVCYVGAFPRRQGSNASSWFRVECLVSEEVEQTYENDAATLIEHLKRIGLESINEDEVAGIQELARAPFPLELQFNVGLDGHALPVVSGSVPFEPNDWMSETRKAEIERLMRWVEERGLADERWKQLEKTLLAKRVPYDDEAIALICYPAYVKLRWRAGHRPDAKAYLVAFAQ